MSLAILCPGRDMTEWLAAFRHHGPEITVEVWPDVVDPAKVDFALVWRHSPGSLALFPSLCCISSLGAGVDSLLQAPDLPLGVPLVRIVDPNLQQSMVEYVCLGALNHFRRFDRYRQQQIEKNWRGWPLPAIGSVRVGILGLGALGSRVATSLASLGFQVHGWSRTRQVVDSIDCYHGDTGLSKMLAITDIVVCLLPLTPATTNIIDHRFLAQLPPGAYLINVGRGEHLVEEDLLAAIRSGHIAGALLDVFREEPLPTGHPFWQLAEITITPHISAITNPFSAVAQVVENYRRMRAGQPLLHQVDRQRGY